MSLKMTQKTLILNRTLDRLIDQDGH